MSNTVEDKRLGKEKLYRLFTYALNFKNNLIAGLIFLIIAMLTQLVSPMIIRFIMDHELVKNPIDLSSIIRWSGIYVLSSAIEAGFQYLSGIELRKTAMKTVSKMRIDLYKKLQDVEISFFDNSASGQIVSKIMNDTEAVQNLYVKVMGQIMISVFYIIGVYIALFIINTGFALAMLIILPMVLGLIYFYTSKARKYNDIIRIKLAQMNAFINESIQGISIIQVFNKQDSIKSEFDTIVKKSYKHKMKLLTLNTVTSYNAVTIMKNIAYILIVYYFGTLFLRGDGVTTVGMLYVYVGYIGILFHHLTQILEQVGEMERSSAAAKQVFALLDRETYKKGDIKPEDIRGEVRFEEVSFFYKEGEPVLKDISIYANVGETVALVGHTGSGKSSLMNLLLKFYNNQSGHIYIDDMDLQELDDQAIRSHIGIVLQEPYLFTGTIFSNIGLNNPDISRKKAIEAMEMLGAGDFLTSLKDGIDTEVVEKGATFSSGQRQLISFARALAHNPKILILDEATSSVDTETEQLIQKAMQVLMKGRTTFIIAHRLSTIRNAHKIYLLEKGRIVEQGSHDELINLAGRYSDMYRAQRLSAELGA